MAHGPEPGTILNEGEPTEPRQAATVIVLRGGAERLEVLLVQRTHKARFMGGAWVFPGGSTSGSETHRQAAVRELEEEAGLRIDDADSLVPFARWITPPEVSIRFDTWFYLARAPEGQEAQPDDEETVDARWVSPADALAGDMLLVFPTIKNLERLGRHGSADALLEWAAGREVKPVQPRVEGQGEAARIVLEDEEED
jgi:8-oxo-dGTP pyrophosphatase MutT (NUDIX family)